MAQVRTDDGDGLDGSMLRAALATCLNDEGLARCARCSGRAGNVRRDLAPRFSWLVSLFAAAGILSGPVFWPQHLGCVFHFRFDAGRADPAVDGKRPVAASTPEADLNVLAPSEGI